MARTKTGEEFGLGRRKFVVEDLWRIAAWGVSATAALTLVSYAGTTERGHDRLNLAVAEIHENLIPSGVQPLRPLDAHEGRRVAETVRVLAADRERLLDRVATLEQSLDGVTGSIARVEQAVKTTPAEAIPAAAEPEVTSSVTPWANVPLQMPAPPQPPALSASELQYGLDLGSASTVAALRTAWTAALRRHGALLEGLNPVVQFRERPRQARAELHLIAGPVSSAAAAARLCAAMTAARAICAPALFDGQRLAGR